MKSTYILKSYIFKSYIHMSNNIFPFDSNVSQADRSGALGQQPRLLWFTGLSGSGKSTLAVGIEYMLHQQGFHTFLLDGDNIRHRLNKDLSFSDADRTENIRRIAEVAALMLDAGLVVLGAFISPFERDRAMIRDIVGADRYVEVFVNCPLEVCEQRDVKGLYQKARAGLLPQFTGIDSPYEAPTQPDVEVRTDLQSLDDSSQQILAVVTPKITLRDGK